MTPDTLYDRTLLEHETNSRNAYAAVVSRRGDIDQLERITAAMNARGLMSRAAVTTHQLGSGAYVRLLLRASGTDLQLAAVLEWLMSDEVRVERLSLPTATMRKYRLGLRLMDIDFEVYTYPAELLNRAPIEEAA